MPVAKQSNDIPAFFNMLGSMKLVIFGVLIGLLILVIGGMLFGIGQMMGINGITLSGVGAGIMAVGRFFIAILFVFFGLVARTDVIWKAGMLVSGALLL